MRVQLNKRDDGTVAIIVALLATTLLVMGAFAVDLGQAYAVKRQLSVSVDASALDAARAVATATDSGVPILGGGKGCETWTAADRAAAEQAAEDTAEATNLANDITDESTVDDVTVTCVTNTSGESLRVEVRVENSRELDSSLSGVIGISDITPARTATAAVIPRLSIGGLRPYAACNTVVDQASLDRDATFTMDLDNKIGICNSTAPGNWGMVNFNGGAATAGEIRDWTEDGYPDAVTAPDPNLDARTGYPSPGSLMGPLTSLLDQVVLFPVVTGVVGTGTNAKYDLTGFMAAKVCGFYLTNTVRGQGSCYDTSQAATYINARPNSVAFIQFRFVDYSAGYSGGGATCAFTDPECKYAVLSAQLYR